MAARGGVGRLDGALQRFASRLLDKVRANPPEDVSLQVPPFDGNWVPFSVATIPNYRGMWPLYAEMKDWTEVSACVALLPDPTGWVRPDFGPEGALVEWGYDVLRVCLAGRSEPDAGRLDELVERFCTSIDTGRRAVDLWTPVYGLDLGDDVAEAAAILGASSLRRPTAEERTQLAWCHRGLIPPWAPPPIFLHTAGTSAMTEHQVAEFDDMVSSSLALSLVMGGRVRTHESMVICRPGDCRAPGFVGELQAFGGALTMSTANEVATAAGMDDVIQVQAVAPTAGRLREHYWFAVDKLRASTQRSRFADVVVDAVVGLENLLLPDSRDELTFKLALRGAWVLGAGNEAARRQWYKRLKSAYEMRSEIVHGGGRGRRKPHAGSDFARREAIDSSEALRLILCHLAASGLAWDGWTANLGDIVFG